MPEELRPLTAEERGRIKGMVYRAGDLIEGSVAKRLLAMLERAEATWRCFHCGFETADRKKAAAHFGTRDDATPVCWTWAHLDADGRASEYQGVLGELGAERQENLRLRSENEALEYRVGTIETDIASRFEGCRTVHEAFNLYDSMEGRALAAEERAERAEAERERLMRHIRKIALVCVEEDEVMACNEAYHQAYLAIVRDLTLPAGEQKALMKAALAKAREEKADAE